MTITKCQAHSQKNFQLTEELPVDSRIIVVTFLSPIIVLVVDILGLIRDTPPLL